MAWNRLSNYATTISVYEGKTRVVYHNTTIVSFDNKTIVLDSSGWQTTTTKRKMNQASFQFALGYQIYQTDFSWYVHYKGMIIPFTDGMILQR